MKYVVANHKNYMSKEETLDYVNKLYNSNFDDNCDLIICPSYIYFPYYENIKNKLGLQDFNLLKPLSGGISIEQIKSLGVSYCIVGHSDNRIHKKETEEVIRTKVDLLLSDDIVPILCFGELEPTTFDTTIDMLSRQLFDILDFQNSKKIHNIILAYEPIWSISNGKDNTEPPTPEVLEKIMLEIKTRIFERYNTDIKILYGGSVNKYNINALNSIDVIDGYLIGKASTNFDDFCELIYKL